MNARIKANNAFQVSTDHEFNGSSALNAEAAFAMKIGKNHFCQV
jgi:hypothetical protein